MKAFFIYRDGKPYGSPTGYTTEKGAKKSLVGCQDWYKVMRPYRSVFKKGEIPEEWITMGIYEWCEYTDSYLFKREVWSRKIWTPYMKEHYQIVEKEYNIDVK